MLKPTSSGVIATNDDATECKLYAVNKGYWLDPHIHYFVHHEHLPEKKRPPEINRGYYGRTTAMRMMVDQVIKRFNNDVQIISFGAGFDTLYWKLKDDGVNVRNFIEVDFPQVTTKKCGIIKKHNQLLEYLTDVTANTSNTELHSAGYHIVAADIVNTKSLISKLRECGVDFRIPILFVVECVLAYIEKDPCDQLLQVLAATCDHAVFINYEPVNLDDAFGHVMIENLRQRECALIGEESCQNLRCQQERFLSNGWKNCKCETMLNIYKSLPVEDRQRIDRLEFLDEVELLDQLLEHYCIIWACNKQWGDFDTLGFV